MPAFIAAALALAPQLLALGMDIEPLIANLLAVIRGAKVTDQMWADLHAREDALRARLDDKSKDTQ